VDHRPSRGNSREAIDPRNYSSKDLLLKSESRDTMTRLSGVPDARPRLLVLSFSFAPVRFRRQLQGIEARAESIIESNAHLSQERCRRGAGGNRVRIP
jgi:hypothetical protein